MELNLMVSTEETKTGFKTIYSSNTIVAIHFIDTHLK